MEFTFVAKSEFQLFQKWQWPEAYKSGADELSFVDSAVTVFMVKVEM